MKLERFFVIIFGAVGLGLFAGAALWGGSQVRFLSSSERATGTVTQLVQQASSSTTGRDRSYTSTYSYYPEVTFRSEQGRQVVFTSRFGSNPPSYSVGEQVEVVYDPLKPENAQIDSFWALWFGPVLCGFLGLVFSGIAGGIALFMVRSARRIAWLKQYGQRVCADIIEVGLDTSTTVNGRHPYRVSAQWRDPRSGSIHVFRSQNVWYNPGPYLQGKTIEVLIDPEKPKRHWIDLSFLPQLAK